MTCTCSSNLPSLAQACYDCIISTEPPESYAAQILADLKLCQSPFTSFYPLASRTRTDCSKLFRPLVDQSRLPRSLRRASKAPVPQLALRLLLRNQVLRSPVPSGPAIATSHLPPRAPRPLRPLLKNPPRLPPRRQPILPRRQPRGSHLQPLRQHLSHRLLVLRTSRDMRPLMASLSSRVCFSPCFRGIRRSHLCNSFGELRFAGVCC